MFIEYQTKRFQRKTRVKIDTCAQILNDYHELGYSSLTLRQLYYQLVGQNLIPNKENEYNKLITTIRDARYAGLISWLSIEDRTRSIKGRAPLTAHEALKVARGFVHINRWTPKNHLDLWQDFVVFVVLEKEALIGVIEDTCTDYDVTFLGARGYSSASSFWRLGHKRLKAVLKGGQVPIVLHLADHDPSGIDMTADLQKRMDTFAGCHVQVKRIGLNMEQVRRYNLIDNPVKGTDSRWKEYVKEFGTSSWELDAIHPNALNEILTNAITPYIDNKKWGMVEKLENEQLEVFDSVMGTG